MYLSKSPTFRFWCTVYAFPAMVPLFLSIAYSCIVAPTVEEALGTQGSRINGQISLMLTICFCLLILLANGMALWHARTGLPAMPVETQPSPRRGPSLYWRLGAALRTFGAHRTQ